MKNTSNLVRAFSLDFSGIARQIISSVYVSDAIKMIDDPSDDEQTAIPCQGLWDTGATNTVISERMVTRLGLPPIAKAKVSGVAGTHETTIHVIDLWLPQHVVIRKMQTAMGTLPPDFDVLIGMDVISGGDFALSNFQGKTTFSYRRPSIATTDYVEHARLTQQAKSVKVERNAPCPCGSGRKYKHCCGRN